MRRHPGGANKKSQGPAFALRARFTATSHAERAENLDWLHWLYISCAVSLIITGLFVHWCDALEHIGDVDDGTLMLPSMWSIDSFTISQTGAEEALCLVEKKDAR
jgi:hypothetical protein